MKTEEVTENPEKIFDKITGKPFWMDIDLEQVDLEKEGIEVEGRLTSEHVVMYLDKKLSLTPPPIDMPKFDVTLDLEELQSRDNIYFTIDAINYNTLKNMVDHCARALFSKKSSEDKDNAFNEQMSDMHQENSAHNNDDESDTCYKVTFNVDNLMVVTYDREHPIESIANMIENEKAAAAGSKVTTTTTTVKTTPTTVTALPK
ncbi:unnamed protein product [Caenorhabditis bovis]|uniref:Uncharacterized protein n=1 Tax=Caenorhabditis bovis TaxID=2654633 RepID=A0A8S1FEK6_9PELO|nr:unnamed protein product [Caenorhabditis bovis]